MRETEAGAERGAEHVEYGVDESGKGAESKSHFRVTSPRKEKSRLRPQAASPSKSVARSKSRPGKHAMALQRKKQVPSLNVYPAGAEEESDSLSPRCATPNTPSSWLRLKFLTSPKQVFSAHDSDETQFDDDQSSLYTSTVETPRRRLIPSAKRMLNAFSKSGHEHVGNEDQSAAPFEVADNCAPHCPSVQESGAIDSSDVNRSTHRQLHSARMNSEAFSTADSVGTASHQDMERFVEPSAWTHDAPRTLEDATTNFQRLDMLKSREVADPLEDGVDTRPSCEDARREITGKKPSPGLQYRAVENREVKPMSRKKKQEFRREQAEMHGRMMDFLERAGSANDSDADLQQQQPLLTSTSKRFSDASATDVFNPSRPSAPGTSTSENYTS